MTSLTPRLDRLERQLAINGNFDFWQRGTSITNRGAGDVNFLADRFKLQLIGTSAIYRMDRSTDVPTAAQSGFKSDYSLSVQCTTADASVAAGDGVWLRHTIEGYDYANIASGRAARLQFWAKSVLAGTYCVSLMNSATDRVYIKEYTLAANTWKKIEIDFTTDVSGTWLTDNGIGLRISWTLMAGTTFQGSADSWQAGNLYATSNQANFSSSTSNIFYLSQVMLVPGDFSGTDVDIPFSRAGKTISEELAMCQRYYEKSFSIDVAPAAGTAEFTSGLGAGYSAGSVVGAVITFNAQKRAIPTLAFFADRSGETATTLSVIDSVTSAFIIGGTSTFESIRTGYFVPRVNKAASYTLGRVYYFVGNWTADAEL